MAFLAKSVIFCSQLEFNFGKKVILKFHFLHNLQIRESIFVRRRDEIVEIDVILFFWMPSPSTIHKIQFLRCTPSIVVKVMAHNF